jgi:hypothetical protein
MSCVCENWGTATLRARRWEARLIYLTQSPRHGSQASRYDDMHLTSRHKAPELGLAPCMLICDTSFIGRKRQQLAKQWRCQSDSATRSLLFGRCAFRARVALPGCHSVPLAAPGFQLWPLVSRRLVAGSLFSGLSYASPELEMAAHPSLQSTDAMPRCLTRSRPRRLVARLCNQATGFAFISLLHMHS